MIEVKNRLQNIRNLRYDSQAGLNVALLAIPQGMAYD